MTNTATSPHQPPPSANSDTPNTWHICPDRTNVSTDADDEAEEHTISTPNISPRRRRRIFRAHQLRQEGLTLEQIADQLNVSIATVHADLRALEENWIALTQDIHDDLLLQQIARLDHRLERLNRLDPIADAMFALGPDAQLTPDQLDRIEERHARRLAQAEREFRMLLKQLHRPHAAASARPFVYPDPDAEPAPYPDDELADPETDRTNLKEPESLSPAIPSKTLEIVPPAASEKNSFPNLNGAAAPPLTPRPNPRRRTTSRRCPAPVPVPADAPPPSDAPHSMRGPNSLRHPGPVSDPVLPPEHEAEAIRLTQRVHEAQANADPMAELDALDELVKLYAK